MKNKTPFLLAALCGAGIAISGCTMCPTQTHERYGHHEQYGRHDQGKMHKQHQHKQKIHDAGPIVFQQTYGGNDVKKVSANMMTRSYTGGTAEMGTIKFKETNDGLNMTVDLMHLRPNTVYTAQVYQCWPCNNTICCAMDAMSVDLPKLVNSQKGEQLQQSYIIRGLTATQLNNAKIVLTRDGGYQAAWGTLKQ